MRIRKIYGTDRAPFDYLERFRALLEANKTAMFIRSGTLLCIMGAQHDGNPTDIIAGEFHDEELATDIKQSAEEIDFPTSVYIIDPLYYLVYSDPEAYPAWYISNHALQLARQPIAVSMLACVCISNRELWDIYSRLPCPCFEVLKALLEHGLLPLKTFKLKHCHPASGRLGDPDRISGLTLWQYLVLGLFIEYNPNWAQAGLSMARTAPVGRVLELFLRFEPDLHISFRLFVDNTWPIGERKFLFDLEGRCITVIITRFIDISVSRVWEQKGERGSSTETATSATKDYTFRDFIELLPLYNKEHILQMIDEQLARGVRNGANVDKSLDRTITDSGDRKIGQYQRVSTKVDPGSYHASASLDMPPPSSGTLGRERHSISVILKSAYMRYGMAALLGQSNPSPCAF